MRKKTSEATEPFIPLLREGADFCLFAQRTI